MFREGKAFKVSPEEREKIMAILKNFLELKEEVLLAVVFGGFLENRKIHDIDVGVYLDSSKFEDWLDMLSFSEELSKEISEKIEIPVDIVLLNEAPQWLRYRAFKGIILVDKNPILRISLVNAAKENILIQAITRKIFKINHTSRSVQLSS